jgi:hypothetical protein
MVARQLKSLITRDVAIVKFLTFCCSIATSEVQSCCSGKDCVIGELQTLTKPQKKKSRGDWSRDLGGQGIGYPRPIQLSGY